MSLQVEPVRENPCLGPQPWVLCCLEFLCQPVSGRAEGTPALDQRNWCLFFATRSPGGLVDALAEPHGLPLTSPGEDTRLKVAGLEGQQSLGHCFSLGKFFFFSSL